MGFMDLLKNNVKHFGSFGSDLPLPVIDQIVSDEHDGSGVTPSELIIKGPQILKDAHRIASEAGFVGGAGNNPVPISYSNSGSSISSPSVAETDFINAELAKYYGMSKSTAYQEALANTAYQRAVADMKAAGLNPSVMFGAGRAQSANSAIYGKEASSGSGGYARSGGSSGKSSNGKLFSSSAYGAISTIGGMIGIVATGRPDGYWIGSQTAQGAMNLMNAFNQFK